MPHVPQIMYIIWQNEPMYYGEETGDSIDTALYGIQTTATDKQGAMVVRNLAVSSPSNQVLTTHFCCWCGLMMLRMLLSHLVSIFAYADEPSCSAYQCPRLGQDGHSTTRPRSSVICVQWSTETATAERDFQFTHPGPVSVSWKFRIMCGVGVRVIKTSPSPNHQNYPNS